MRGRTAALTVAGVVAATAPLLAWRRWSLADDPTGGAPLALPDGEEMVVATADGARLAALRCGPEDGPVIVLAHGWTADRRVWASTARRLVAGGRQVVVYDQRGHGGSTVGRDGCSIEALADDLRSVLEAVGRRHVTVGGHSMGGMAAQMFAARHPDVLVDRVGGLVLVSTAAGQMSYGARYEAAALAVVTAPVVERAMHRAHLGPFLVRGSFGRRPSLVGLQATLESFTATPAQTRGELLQAIAGMDLVAGLAAIKVPVVIVSGSRDTLTLPRASRLMHRLVPGSTLETIKGAGHQLVFEDPDRLAAVLLAASAPSDPDRPDPSPTDTHPTPVAHHSNPGGMT